MFILVLDETIVDEFLCSPTNKANLTPPPLPVTVAAKSTAAVQSADDAADPLRFDLSNFAARAVSVRLRRLPSCQNKDGRHKMAECLPGDVHVKNNPNVDVDAHDNELLNDGDNAAGSDHDQDSISDTLVIDASEEREEKRDAEESRKRTRVRPAKRSSSRFVKYEDSDEYEKGSENGKGIIIIFILTFQLFNQ